MLLWKVFQHFKLHYLKKLYCIMKYFDIHTFELCPCNLPTKHSACKNQFLMQTKFKWYKTSWNYASLLVIAIWKLYSTHTLCLYSVFKLIVIMLLFKSSHLGFIFYLSIFLKIFSIANTWLLLKTGQVFTWF